MRTLLVLAEHRMGELRDITFEMLTKGRQLAKDKGTRLTTLLLGCELNGFADKLAEHADRVLVVEDKKLRNFNAEAYQKTIANIIKKHKPLLTMIGHTGFGLDLAPSLAVELKMPLATGCIDLGFEDEGLVVFRQMYGGKVTAKASLQRSEGYLVTIQPASFEVEEAQPMKGEIVPVESPLEEKVERRRFIEYVEPPKGEVDITDADILVSVGRGIKDEENIEVISELAEALGGVLACSRPVIDKGWLPKDRQVGSSGKTVKPKLYIAIGISGAFQHVLGMKDSELIVAINRDSKAPVFNVADYGIVDDLFKLVPELVNKIHELKTS
ncbi:MAG: electron transfer flavoprotein subunit alpha/FixB family protein [Nitrososphaeria archaeon]|nr:electron transfer flavoprotein subunit alpha/FixB family protein [Nitrososphaeria archaeon]NIQ33483.1 electron transfer flavoprotein subunit alpha/FixB family protein [Nitrososphaeria archaeon]